ncbi:MAG: ABC transporter permease [Fibrobacteria bacterium]|nr:ABC transporter permease [Fibrobacteria bacterium]
MNSSIQIIPIHRLLLVSIPAIVVILILLRWTDKGKTAIIASIRMAVQLMLIGYVLHYIFNAEQPFFVILALTVMFLTACWISTRTMPGRNIKYLIKPIIAIGIGGGLTLLLVLITVFQVNPFIHPRITIPIAGMIFANAMNAISLAADRFHSELKRKANYVEARNQALNTALIPVINSLFAVGLVSLPGMMTGQILSGVAPHIAVRYQIMVMFMIFGASGISTIIYLKLMKDKS